MFIENKYFKWYNNIIEIAKNREIDEYVEKHHIIPKCMGGSNDDNNLVKLTAREHFVCHWLLTKFVADGNMRRKMLFALGRFVQTSPNQQRLLSSKQYEKARKSISEARTGVKRSEEVRRKISEGHMGQKAWNKGLKLPCTEQRRKALMENWKKRKENGPVTLSEEHKRAISETKKGKPSGMLGKQHSEETKKLMSQNMKGKRGPQVRITCPNCKNENVTHRHVKFCKGV